MRDIAKPYWPRFSLRAFVVLITVMCCWLGWNGWNAHRLRESIAIVNELGGKYSFNYESPFDYRKRLGGAYTYERDYALRKANSSPPRLTGPEWLQCIVGVSDIEQVRLGYRRAEDVHLRSLGRHGGLRYLDLTQTDVTDEGLAFLANCHKLQTLHLGQTNVTDAGIAKLRHLTNLQSLRLDNTQVTSSVVDSLKSFRKLRSLSIANTKFTDDAQRELESALPDCHVNR